MNDERLLRLPEVMHSVGLGRSAIYERIATHTFPKPIQLSGRAVGWLSSDVQAWIDAQVKATRDTA